MSTDIIKPCGDKILVKRADAETKTKGGLIIPELATEEQAFGTVIAVGPGKVDEAGRRHPMTVKAGDKVYFTKNAVIEVKHNGEDLLMMKEDRILLIEL